MAADTREYYNRRPLPKTVTPEWLGPELRAVERCMRSIVQRAVVDGWYQDNVAAAQTAVTLGRLSVGTFAASSWLAVRAGSVTGIVVKSNAARTAGTLTVEVYKNGTATGLTAVLDATNTTVKATTQARLTDQFSAGDELDVRITTSAGWTPVTADIRVSIEVET